MMRRHRGWLLAAALLLAGCEGYNVQLGTTASNLSGFHVVYEMPATSLRPWAERPAAAPPPPDDGSSGFSTLPGSEAALPPERPPAAAAR
jgi:hypothetical protein